MTAFRPRADWADRTWQAPRTPRTGESRRVTIGALVGVLACLLALGSVALAGPLLPFREQAPMFDID